MSEWKPGWVQSMTTGEVRVEKGQRWGYFKAGPDGMIPLLPADPEVVLPLVVVSTSASGEVVLRPADPQKADRMFPVQETTFKGKPVTSRVCPFMWVDERQAKGSQGAYQTGDLLCHEAWDVWRDMHLHT